MCVGSGHHVAHEAWPARDVGKGTNLGGGREGEEGGEINHYGRIVLYIPSSYRGVCGSVSFAFAQPVEQTLLLFSDREISSDNPLENPNRSVEHVEAAGNSLA